MAVQVEIVGSEINISCIFLLPSLFGGQADEDGFTQSRSHLSELGRSANKWYKLVEEKT